MAKFLGVKERYWYIGIVVAEVVIILILIVLLYFAWTRKLTLIETIKQQKELEDQKINEAIETGVKKELTSGNAGIIVRGDTRGHSHATIKEYDKPPRNHGLETPSDTSFLKDGRRRSSDRGRRDRRRRRATTSSISIGSSDSSDSSSSEVSSSDDEDGIDDSSDENETSNDIERRDRRHELDNGDPHRKIGISRPAGYPSQGVPPPQHGSHNEDHSLQAGSVGIDSSHQRSHHHHHRSHADESSSHEEAGLMATSPPTDFQHGGFPKFDRSKKDDIKKNSKHSTRVAMQESEAIPEKYTEIIESAKRTDVTQGYPDPAEEMQRSRAQQREELMKQHRQEMERDRGFTGDTGIPQHSHIISADDEEESDHEY